MAPLPEIPAIPPVVVMQAGSVTVPAPSGVTTPAKPSVDPPLAPSIADPVPSDWPGRARKLAATLREPNGRDAVRTEVEALSSSDRDALERALTALPAIAPKLLAETYLLRRIIRFTRNPPAPAKRHQVLSPAGGTVVKGTARGTPVTFASVAGGVVTFRTGVDVKSGKPPQAGYSLTYVGPDDRIKDLRWLQFFWRQVVADLTGTGARLTSPALRARADNKGSKPYQLTTDGKAPRWTVDSTSTKSAFYEEYANRDAGQLAMFDAPDSTAQANVIADYFNKMSPIGEVLLKPPARVTTHFRAATYLVDGMDVVYRANIHLVWEFRSATEPLPTLANDDRPSWRLATELDPEHRASLELQYPDHDYLPGPRLGAPQLMDDFEMIPSLNDSDWSTAAGHPARYAEIAKLANARLIPDVTGIEESSIPAVPQDVTHVTGGRVTAQNKGLAPGLNYSPTFAQEGETGFLDRDLAYRGAEMPVDRLGPLPQVATKLSSRAFQVGVLRPKSAAVATMRHEMMHAAHDHAAICWLLAWRDELTTDSFKDWLTKKRKAGKRPTKVERSYVATGVTNDTTATEILAWTEGVVTGLPFLPTAVEFDTQLKEEGLWPGAVMELRGAGEKYNLRSGPEVDEAAIEAAVRDRIRSVTCRLTKDQRSAMRTWLQLLLDLEHSDKLPSPASDTQRPGIDLLKASFNPVRDYLNLVLAVEKTCP